MGLKNQHKKCLRISEERKTVLIVAFRIFVAELYWIPFRDSHNELCFKFHHARCQNKFIYAECVHGSTCECCKLLRINRLIMQISEISTNLFECSELQNDDGQNGFDLIPP
ncbi:CLUMA_CG006974, isoform A [Clunio marinus]|uniref:CLUMA_CG006974, isoform A n=1 Tax=Clunio marinus TaxID=568069 RepID=A0A1J1I3J8_9DIPT|nr:CLUMA_CG006974, isoform A [Clunio marinus]